MKYIVIGIIVVIALVAWWLSKRNAVAATHEAPPADSHGGHEAPSRERGVGGSGFFSGGGNT